MLNCFKPLVRIRDHTIWTAKLDAASVVVDAGAHDGEFSWEIEKRFHCRCLLIEPNPDLAAKLVPPDRGTIVQAALTYFDGEVPFVIRQNAESGSITEHTLDSNVTKTNVNCVSLESLCKDQKIEKIDLLKLDIEGAEFDLIERTPDYILKQIGQLTIEFHDFIPEFQGRSLYEKAKKRLIAMGFICLPMTFRSHGDTLFVNRTLLNNKAYELGIKLGGPWILKWRELSSST